MAEDDFRVPVGQLTFDAEGMETPGRYFSRKPHVPGPWSGVTIGRGYDMGQHSREAIVEDLTAAGVPRELAERFAPAAGLEGEAARRFIRSAGLGDAEITPAQQKALFIATYEALARDCMRICRKHDVVATYGRTVWEALEPKICDVVVDLRYRGDYKPKTRKRVQPLIVANDLAGMREALADQPYWCGQFGVPRDRFRRRRDYLASALPWPPCPPHPHIPMPDGESGRSARPRALPSSFPGELPFIDQGNAHATHRPHDLSRL